MFIISIPIVAVFAVLFIYLAIARPSSKGGDIMPPVVLTSIQPTDVVTPTP